MIKKVIAGIIKDLEALPKKWRAEWKKADKKKVILLNLPYVLAAYFCNKVAWVYRTSYGDNAADKMMATMTGLATMFKNPIPSFQIRDVLIGVVCAIGLRLIVYFKAKNAKKFRKGVEYGSARWGNPGAKSQGIKQLMAGGGIIIVAQTVIPQLTTLFS